MCKQAEVGRVSEYSFRTVFLQWALCKADSLISSETKGWKAASPDLNNCLFPTSVSDLTSLWPSNTGEYRSSSLVPNNQKAKDSFRQHLRPTAETPCFPVIRLPDVPTVCALSAHGWLKLSCCYKTSWNCLHIGTWNWITWMCVLDTVTYFTPG